MPHKSKIFSVIKSDIVYILFIAFSLSFRLVAYHLLKNLIFVTESKTYYEKNYFGTDYCLYFFKLHTR